MGRTTALNEATIQPLPPTASVEPQQGWRTLGGAGSLPRAEPYNVDDLVEFFFFAYRDFVAEADRLLEDFGVGRAHHRVLHFINRRPGLTVAALLEILKITKQSLNRVLKHLRDLGFVEARAGTSDRRQRQLFVTAKGAHLARELASLQSRRVSRALEALRPEARSAAVEFLLAMADAKDRGSIEGGMADSGDLARAQPSKG
jgi:DNA-binding MarR family transcriptional regulator